MFELNPKWSQMVFIALYTILMFIAGTVCSEVCRGLKGPVGYAIMFFIFYRIMEWLEELLRTLIKLLQ